MRYLCSLPNVKGDGPQYELYSDDPGEIDAFVKKHDVPGRAVYCCTNPLVPGASRRCIETVARIERLSFDVDFKDLAESPAEIDARLRDLPLMPTTVNDSGGGRHVVWELREPIEAGDPLFDGARETLRRLTARLSADPAPAHPAALLRVVGTHNSKRGEPVPVRPLWGSGRPVDIADLETLVDLLPADGTLHPQGPHQRRRARRHLQHQQQAAGRYRRAPRRHAVRRGRRQRRAPDPASDQRCDVAPGAGRRPGGQGPPAAHLRVPWSALPRPRNGIGMRSGSISSVCA